LAVTTLLSQFGSSREEARRRYRSLHLSRNRRLPRYPFGDGRPH